MALSLWKPKTLPRFEWYLEGLSKIIYRLFFVVFLIVAMVGPAPRTAKADVDVNIGVGFPPHIGFAAPPMLVVLPGTYIYVVPDIMVDLFFYDGWWWRPWEGHWYRSRYYESGWEYYRGVPHFYGWIESDWRDYYRHRHWRGHRWNYKRIPYHEVERNWRDWERNKYWERQRTWGVEGWQPRERLRSPDREENRKYQEFRPRESKSQREEGQKYREVRPESSKSRDRDEGFKSREVRPERSHEGRGNYGKTERGEKFQKGKVKKCVSC